MKRYHCSTPPKKPGDPHEHTVEASFCSVLRAIAITTRKVSQRVR